MSRKGPSTIGRCGSLWAAALLVLGVAGARAADDYKIKARQSTVNFPRSPASQRGWVESPDIAYVIIYCYIPVNVTCSTGSDMGRTGSPKRVPLQITTRVVGKGAYSNGQVFNEPQWTSWTNTWLAAGQSTTVRFDALQTCGMGFKAQVYRNGLADAGGVYGQATPATFTIVPAN